MDWLLFQLADSAFPAGGFAHSGGLEAAAQLGEVGGVAGVRAFAVEALWQAGYASLPLLNGTYDTPSRWKELDALDDAFLLGEVPNRASRTQGRAFFATCVRSFAEPALERLQGISQQAQLCLHYAPTVGVTLATLGLSRLEAQQWFLFTTLRGVLSAAIRLGLIGPHAAQGMQRELAPVLTEIFHQCANLLPEQITQTAPFLDLWQSLHNRLYSRLFLS